VQVLILCATNLTAQTRQADKVREQVGKIGTLGTITVYMPDGHEYYGSVRRIGADDFSVDEVDLLRIV
jgi:hypothetical protein